VRTGTTAIAEETEAGTIITTGKEDLTTVEATTIVDMLEVAEDGTTLVAHIQEMIVVTAIERTVEGLAEAAEVAGMVVIAGVEVTKTVEITPTAAGEVAVGVVEEMTEEMIEVPGSRKIGPNHLEEMKSWRRSCSEVATDPAGLTLTDMRTSQWRLLELMFPKESTPLLRLS